MKIWALLLFLLFPCALQAAQPDNFDYSNFSRIPILHEGRIKPLDSFARVTLKKISGNTRLADASAAEWLAHALFAPDDAMEQNLFVVHSAELIHLLSLSSRPDKRYSFKELGAAFADQQSLMESLAAKDKKSLTPDEQELIRLYNNVDDFAEIIGTFSLLLPLPDADHDARAQLGLPDDAPVSYLDLLKIRQALEQNKSDVAGHLGVIETLDKNNSLLRIIPPYWEGTQEWLSPWAVIEKGAGSPASAELFHEWQTLAAAYNSGDVATWAQTSQTLRYVGTHAGNRPWALSLEVAYNAFDPLDKSLLAYIIGLALAFTFIMRRTPAWASAAYWLMTAGAGVHGMALCARMAILMRPPVSTLYESMIFVSFITIAFGLWMERHRKNADGLIISGAVGCLLLGAAKVFAADGDTLEVLVAVLNTNFWLATHVVCITTGYGASLVAGTLAHLYLFKRARRTTPPQELTLLYRRIHSVALVALLFTAVGTMLGGIWADQSWGRFWGWDPKENGALWIVLWLIWVLHGRIAGQLRELGFAACVALINIVVALAWVGVNLLSVGLHSYGFTDTAASSLLTFCTFEIVFVGAALGFIARHERGIHAR